MRARINCFTPPSIGPWFRLVYTMAKPRTEGIKNLKEQLTCALCLSHYTEPVILPCHHVFCSECIQPVIRESQVFPCPKCRRESDRDALQTAFMVNTLKDVYEKLKEERGFVSLSVASSLPCVTDGTGKEPTDPTRSAQEQHTCMRHRSQSLDLYCQDCKVLMCRDCVLDESDKLHPDHQYTYVDKMAADGRKTLTDKMTALNDLRGRLETASEVVLREKKQIDQQETDITKKISEEYVRLIQILEEERESALAKLNMVMDQKRIVLNAQEQTLKIASSNVNQEMKQLSTAISRFSDQDIVNFSLVQKTDALIETIEMLLFEPLEAADVGGITPADKDAIRKVCRSCALYYLPCGPKTQLAGEGIQSVVTNKAAHFGIKLHDAYGDVCVVKQDVIVQLKSLRNGLISNASVSVDTQHPARYLASYTVETSGKYELDVLVNGQSIPVCPLSLRVRKPPHQVWVRCVEISSLQSPTHLAIVGDMLYVSECGADRVTIYNNKLEKISTIENLKGPGKVTFDSDANMYVCTTTDHKLHKIAPNGTLLSSIGGQGKESDKFNFPTGICYHSQKLYVCDCENYRIKVYDCDLTLLSMHEKKVMGARRWCFPSDLAVDSQGMIYVVDSHNHRISVFDEHWKSQQTIGRKGTGPGELHDPVSIHIDEDDQIFVTESNNNRVSVFSTSGQFVANFGQRYLSNPKGLTVDQDGFVYVSHSEQNVVVFC